MEKINIAELLKYCPQGMELDCTICNNVVTLEGVDTVGSYPIRVVSKSGFHFTLTCKGHIYAEEDAKCVIFPKGKTTWKGFVPPCQFKDGDVVAAEDNDESIQLFLLKRFIHRINANDYNGDCYFGWDFQGNKLFKEGIWSFERLATKEEKVKLFQAIKDNGYKWNNKTKTLEKLVIPKFKLGNRIKSKESEPIVNTIIKVYEDHYELDDGGILFLSSQDNWELVSNNKFDITTLKAFDSRVLVRDSSCYEWEADIFGRYSDGYITLGGGKWKQCIPYEGNEHLFGTTNDCDDFYKTWIDE